MHQYWGFGLNIESEIKFPELLPATFNRSHLKISIGKTPDKLEGDDVVHKVRMSASPSEYLLDVNNVARYYAGHGNTIVIEPYPGSDIESVRLFMLSNAMAAILHQQNKIPLHASGIVTEAGLVLFTGPSGIGKSTTVYGLMQHGYKLFTDDVCVLNYDAITSTVEAVASYPMMKLWENTFEKISASPIDKTYRVRPELPKYGVFQHDQFTTARFPVSHIFILKSHNLSTDYSCHLLNKVEAFKALQQNTYRRGQVDIMNLRQAHFQMITKLTEQVAVYEVKRSTASQDMNGFIQFIKEHMTLYAKA
jgi:hypothetical protein